MWEEVIIGKGNIGCTTVKCWFHDNPNWCDLSGNSVGYRVSMPNILRTSGMTIFKGTREGNKITTLLANNEGEKLNAYLLKIFFSNAKPGVIVNAIEMAYAEGVSKGKEFKQYEIRKVLGL